MVVVIDRVGTTRGEGSYTTCRRARKTSKCSPHGTPNSPDVSVCITVVDILLGLGGKRSMTPLWVVVARADILRGRDSGPTRVLSARFRATDAGTIVIAA